MRKVKTKRVNKNNFFCKVNTLEKNENKFLKMI